MKKYSFRDRFEKSKILVFGANYEENDYNKWSKIDPNYIGIGKVYGNAPQLVIFEKNENVFDKDWRDYSVMNLLRDLTGKFKKKKFENVYFDIGTYQHYNTLGLIQLNLFIGLLLKEGGSLYIPSIHSIPKEYTEYDPVLDKFVKKLSKPKSNSPRLYFGNNAFKLEKNVKLDLNGFKFDYDVFTPKEYVNARKRTIKSRYICSNCGIGYNYIKRCKSCKSAYYCNVDCQLENWKEHKKVCIPFIEGKRKDFDGGNDNANPIKQIKFDEEFLVFDLELINDDQRTVEISYLEGVSRTIDDLLEEVGPIDEYEILPIANIQQKEAEFFEFYGIFKGEKLNYDMIKNIQDDTWCGILKAINFLDIQQPDIYEVMLSKYIDKLKLIDVSNIKSVDEFMNMTDLFVYGKNYLNNKQINLPQMELYSKIIQNESIRNLMECLGEQFNKDLKILMSKMVYYLEEKGKLMLWGMIMPTKVGISSNGKILSPEYFNGFGEKKIIDVALGEEHMLCLTEDKKIWGLGINNQRQISPNLEMYTIHLSPIEIKGFKDDVKIKKVFASYNTSACLTENNEFYMWGSLPENSSGVREIKRYLKNAKPVVDVTFGFNTILCLVEGGDLFTWGYGGNGQLGKRYVNYRNAPKKIKFFNEIEVISISSGRLSAGCVDKLGQAWVWGYNGYFNLGLGDSNDRFKPTKLDAFGDMKVIQIFMSWKFSLFLLEDGSVWACGERKFGKLGLAGKEAKTPKRITALDGMKVVKIYAGRKSSACITQEGIVFAWGVNVWGQLGLGNTDSKDTPTRIEAFDDKEIIKLVLADQYSAAIVR